MWPQDVGLGLSAVEVLASANRAALEDLFRRLQAHGGPHVPVALGVGVSDVDDLVASRMGLTLDDLQAWLVAAGARLRVHVTFERTPTTGPRS